jgi:hypothetical protein
MSHEIYEKLSTNGTAPGHVKCEYQSMTWNCSLGDNQFDGALRERFF